MTTNTVSPLADILYIFSSLPMKCSCPIQNVLYYYYCYYYYLAQTVRLNLRCDVVSTCSMIPASSKNKVPLWKRHPKLGNSMKFNLSTSIFRSEGSKFDVKTTSNLTTKLVICTQSWSASGNNNRKLLDSNSDIQFQMAIPKLCSTDLWDLGVPLINSR